jgi:hypothetical protein
LLDTSGSNNYVSMGTQQMISVPYALFANKANESQTLSINGNNLSISSGNTVTLPNNSGGTGGAFEQVKSITAGTDAIAATSSPDGSILFIVTNGSGGYQLVKYLKDINTGTYIGSNSITIPSSIFSSPWGVGIAVYDTTVYVSGSNNIWSTSTNLNGGSTVNVVGYSTSHVTHPLYSDGSFLYMSVWNSGYPLVDSIVKFTVLGTGNAVVYSASYPFVLQTGQASSIVYDYFFSDGNYMYDVEQNGTVNKYSLTGSFISSGDSSETSTVGLANISSSLLFLISFNTNAGLLLLEPISKP